MTVRLTVVGGGRMGEALVGGLLSAGWAAPEELAVVELVEARQVQLSRLFPGVDVRADVPPSEGAVVAVKPGDVVRACSALAGGGVRRVLSIAAGVPLATLEGALGDGVAVVRAMPNTPALVRAGAAAIAGGHGATEDDLAWAEAVLGAVGIVVRVSEPLLDAVTGLSGSGPAYVFLVAEALVEAGVLVGLPRPVSQALAVQTLLGSAQLLASSDQGAAELRAAVMEAVVAATERSRDLGRTGP